MPAAWKDHPPTPPPGGAIQSAWRFHDRGWAYELFRVYGAVDSSETNIAHLDEPLSYWCATWELAGAPSSRWLSYGNARRLHRLTFGQFSSIEEMRTLTQTLWPVR